LPNQAIQFGDGGMKFEDVTNHQNEILVPRQLHKAFSFRAAQRKRFFHEHMLSVF